MIPLVTYILLFLTGIIAGIFGAALGLGGGVIMIPILTLIFHVPMHTAIAASVVAVIATSSAAAIHYVSDRLSNIRLGMTLEIATTMGAIIGGLLAAHSPDRVLRLVFAVFLAYTAIILARGGEHQRGGRAEVAVSLDSGAGTAAAKAGSDDLGAWGDRFHDPSLGREVAYKVRNLPAGLGASFIAGNLSGLLGVGGGLIKVPVMTLLMNVPFKAAAATSNFMIGVTAVASAFIYYSEGLVNPLITSAVALGVFAGATFGAGWAPKLSSRLLVQVFSVVLVAEALLMSAQALGLPIR
ncbi:MAG: sulfite exporter TauE/SafE family protein [Firmicutes bacterium]|nr:sulfite exporter TauE/SafE family protein [Bacillota bacterium]